MIGATMTRCRHARVDELGDGLEPRSRRARARLHRAGELAVERGDGERDLDQSSLRHGAKNVEIAQDERGFGDDADGMIGRGQKFEDATHDAVAPLDRLIGVGVGADGDGARTIGGIGELTLERSSGIGLGEQLGLEIEPGRQAEKSVGWPREAIDAAMLAAAIGIDRAVERRYPGEEFRVMMRLAGTSCTSVVSASSSPSDSQPSSTGS